MNDPQAEKQADSLLDQQRSRSTAKRRPHDSDQHLQYPLQYKSRSASQQPGHSSTSSSSSDEEFETKSDDSREYTSEGSLSEHSQQGEERLVRRKGCDKFCLHLRLLLLKNYWLYRRNLKSTFFMLILPVVSCLIILFFQTISGPWREYSTPDPPILQTPTMQHCYGDPSCVTIGYSIIGDENTEYQWIHDIMREVANEHHLLFNKDVKLSTVGSIQKINRYYENHPNTTWYAVIWCTTEWELTPNVSIPCQYQYNTEQQMIFYSIMYNVSITGNLFLTTFSMPYPTDFQLLSLKQSVDNGILAQLQKNHSEDEEAPRINSTWSHYPLPQDRMIKDMNLVSQAGLYFFILGPLFIFSTMLLELSKEKELKLRQVSNHLYSQQGLGVVGVSHNVFWVSWFIIGVAISSLCSLILVLTGIICQFDYFVNTAFMYSFLRFNYCRVNFLIFFVYTLNLVALAFFMSTLVPNQSTAQTLSYVVLLISIMMEFLLSASEMICSIFFNEATSGTFQVIFSKILFMFNPSFITSILFSSVMKISAAHFMMEEFGWIEGRAYTLDDFFNTGTSGNFVTGEGYYVPPAFRFFCLQLLYTSFYLLFTWYFDHTIASNRGVADPPYFMFTRSYWGCSSGDIGIDEIIGEKKKKKYKMGHDYLPSTSQSKQFDSVKKEKFKVKEFEANNVACDGLRIVNIQKTYSKLPFGWKSDKDVHAVKGIYLEVPDRELLCLLGHNGAGKSTLFNMMTGIISATSGKANVFGFDVRTQQEQIRYIMGVVPQFDILWGDLTALEHMHMFSLIKGVPTPDILSSSEELLRSVGLYDVRHARTCSFSGGMKRRLSVAISAIGNPRIIFMDEPTTGMDPVSRKDVWTLIQQLKKTKVMVLTTHAMEEADVLSDRIAVISDGRLQCVGTPLFLKNQFGDGYKVNLVCNPGNEQKIIDLMNMIAPSSRLVDESGGSMVFAIPLSSICEIKPLFKLIEDASRIENPHLAELKELLNDCGISHTTLEEVFMKVTGKKVSKYVKVEHRKEGSQEKTELM